MMKNTAPHTPKRLQHSVLENALEMQDVQSPKCGKRFLRLGKFSDTEYTEYEDKIMISRGKKPYSDRSQLWLKQELIRRSGQLDNAPDDIHKEFYQNRISCLEAELNSRGSIPPTAQQGGCPPDHPAAFSRP